MNNFEIMMELQKVCSLKEALTLCVKEGAKDMFVMWYKENKMGTIKQMHQTWKEAMPEKVKGATGFASGYYKWLADTERTEEEATSYIMDVNNTENVRRHLSKHLSVWRLTVAVRASLKEEIRNEDPLIKDAWDFLKAEMARTQPRKSKVHPDKVSSFGNEELTRAYTEAFQSLNK